MRNGIFVKSNTKRFTEFTNCNLSHRLVKLTLLFVFNDVEWDEFPSNCINRTSDGGIGFSLQSPEFYSCIQFEIRKRLTLLNCEAASLAAFTAMCPKEQQTSDNLIVKDYCFIIEICVKFSFRGYISHLSEA